MEIEFNPNRAAASATRQPVAKSAAPAPRQDSASLEQTGALMSAIDGIPLVRPEKVDGARVAISGANYPPDAMLKAVASLFAENIR